jgi:hypothetical protein
MYVRLFARMEELGFHSTDFCEIRYTVKNFLYRIEVCLKADKKQALA